MIHVDYTEQRLKTVFLPLSSVGYAKTEAFLRALQSNITSLEPCWLFTEDHRTYKSYVKFKHLCQQQHPLVLHQVRPNIVNSRCGCPFKNLFCGSEQYMLIDDSPKKKKKQVTCMPIHYIFKSQVQWRQTLTLLDFVVCIFWKYVSHYLDLWFTTNSLLETFTEPASAKRKIDWKSCFPVKMGNRWSFYRVQGSTNVLSLSGNKICNESVVTPQREVVNNTPVMPALLSSQT